MDSPILSFDDLRSNEECDAPFQPSGVCLHAEMDVRMDSMSIMSPNSEIYGGSKSLSVVSSSSRRNSIENLSTPPSSAFSFPGDQDFVDFICGETSDAIAPNCDESLPSVSENCLPDWSQKVPVEQSRAERQSARSTEKIREDSPPSPVENESGAVESNTSGATASAVSSNGLLNMKIVKVIKSSGSGNSAEDVLKALDDKNRKNALLARSNRAKKKAYIQGLEEQVEKLTEEKTGLEKAIEEKNERKGELEGEVEYLRRVLLNDSALAGLLKNMDRACELRGSGGSRKRGSDGDYDYTSPHKRPRRPSSGKGVCLHVTADSASLEVCPNCCSRSAAEGK